MRKLTKDSTSPDVAHRVSASEAEQGSSGAATGGTGAGGVTGVSRTPQRRHSLGHGRSSARTSKAATPEAKLQGRRSLSTRAASAAAADGAADTSPTTTGVDASSCRATPLRSALQKLNAGSAGRSLGLGYPGSQHAAASPGVGSLAGPDLPSASTSPVALVATRSSSFTRAAAAHLRASAPLNRRSLNLSSGVAGPAGGAGSLRGSVHGLGTGEVSLGAGAWGVGVVLSSREREREAKDSARGRERDRDSLSLKSLTSSTSSVGGGIGRRFPGIGRLSGTAAPAAATPREDAAANAVGQQGQQPQQQAAQGEKHAPEPRAQLPRPAFESASRLPPAPSAAPAASAVLDLAGLGVRALSLGPPRSSLAQPGSAKAALGQQEPSSAKAALLSQPGSARVVTPTNQFAPFSHGPFATTPNGSQAGGPGGGAVSAAGLLMPGSAGAVQVAAWGATSPAMSCSMGLTPLPMMLPSASRVAREEGSERAPEGVGASNGSGSEVALPGLPFQHGLALLAGGRATGTLALGGHLAAAAGLSLGSAGKGAGGVLRRTLSDPDLLAAAGLVATGAVVIAGDAGAEVRGLQAEAAAHAAVAAQ